jgi:hypothetical protein
VHNLGVFSFFQITVLLITKNLKLLFNQFHLQWLCFNKTYHQRTLITTFSHIIRCVKLKGLLHAYMSMIAILEIVCLCVSIFSYLDCKEELSYNCDCCECAGCCQGK